MVGPHWYSSSYIGCSTRCFSTYAEITKLFNDCPIEAVLQAVTDEEPFRECKGQCCDEHKFCNFWAKIGECKLNAVWMSEQCPLSCRLCPTDLSQHKPIPRRITSTSTMNGMCTRTNIPNNCFRDECFHQSYRTFDGSCNNLANSLMGAAYTPYVRLLDPAYDDGINAVVGSLRQNRPNARLVSRSLLSSRRMIASNASSMLMQFGQFLSHDITKNKLVGRCTCSGGPECMIVALGREDRRLAAFLSNFISIIIYKDTSGQNACSRI
ncbi:unnamed protein product [Gongylonema pulchrum]|uniref:ShKT domain-containing protein n=1 Tax=Gongylonema pulchrum TaxID=637853 RepID=A0A183E8K6_9BILA|nr:unnamed protein product [Gongylonema pulchrum]